MEEELNIILSKSIFPLIDWCSDCEVCHKNNCKVCIVTKIQYNDTESNRWVD